MSRCQLRPAGWCLLCWVDRAIQFGTKKRTGGWARAGRQLCVKLEGGLEELCARHPPEGIRQ